MQQDFLLVRKMKNGDEKAMDVFVRQYYAQILQYCSYHCADREWAQDLTQETFEHFFRKLADYRYHGKSLNYLYTIARNLCIDWGRKNRKQIMESAVKVEDRQKVPLQENEIIRSGQYSGMDETGRLDDKLLIEAALKKLPEELREAVILHYFQEMSMRETAGILQIGLPLVKYRIKRAKELLRESLGEEKSF